MEIFLQSLNGTTRIIQLLASSTIAEVKTEIQSQKNIPFDNQKLIFAGQRLEEGQTLSACDFGKESFLVLILKG